MTHERAAALTKTIAYLLFAISLVWGLAAFPPFDLGARFYLDLLHWPLGDGRPDWDQDTMWLSSVGAGLVCALAAFYLLVVAPAVRSGNREIVRSTAIAALAWFVVDSAGSYWSGVPMNVVFNAVTLLPLLAPMYFFARAQNAAQTQQSPTTG